MKKRITEAEVKQLYALYHTPPHVIGHCRAVADVATTLARNLNAHGFQLDEALVNGAALAHDVARTQEAHWHVGAEILAARGYDDEAAIVETHMFYTFNTLDKLNETDMVCLGDRLVKEDRYVGLDERIDYILHKAPDDPCVRARILERKEETRALLTQIENVIGVSVDALFSGEKIRQEKELDEQEEAGR